MNHQKSGRGQVNSVDEESAEREILREYSHQLHEGIESLQQQLALIERHYLGDEQGGEAHQQRPRSISDSSNVYLQILKAIQVLTDNIGRASSMDIAVLVNLSRTQIWRYLIEMEGMGQVERVGKRGGWRLPR